MTYIDIIESSTLYKTFYFFTVIDVLPSAFPPAELYFSVSFAISSSSDTNINAEVLDHFPLFWMPSLGTFIYFHDEAHPTVSPVKGVIYSAGRCLAYMG